MESTGLSIISTPSPLKSLSKRNVTMDNDEESTIFDSFTVEEGSEDGDTDIANSSSSNHAEISLDEEENECKEDEVLKTSVKDRSINHPLLIDLPASETLLETSHGETLSDTLFLSAKILSSTPLKEPLMSETTASAMETPFVTGGNMKRRNLDIYSSQEEEESAEEESRQDRLSSTGESSSTESGSSGSKKLKRRNQAMYTSNEDTE